MSKRVHACVLACVLAYLRAYLRACLRACLRTYMRACVYVCVCVCVCARARVYMRVRIYICVCVYASRREENDSDGEKRLTLEGLHDDVINPDCIEIRSDCPIRVFRGLFPRNHAKRLKVEHVAGE